MPIERYLIWVPLLPLLAAVLIGTVGLGWLRSRSHWLAIAGIAGAWLCAMAVWQGVRGSAQPGDGHDAAGAPAAVRTLAIYEWFRAGPAGGPSFRVEMLVDPLTCVMLATVLTVSLLVTIYSAGYMRDHHWHAERGYERFFAFICLFVFSMCMLVLGGNFLLLYLGWELVGLCSYLLIGFYYDRPAAAAAAKKAFLVNRVGDFGFGLGILLIYLHFGRLDYGYVFAHVGSLTQTQVTTIALLLFCGAVGKSAQLPLHVWLPDAMEGPTPVSALIHAATMVTAGVYMVARCAAIFTHSALAMAVVASIGAVTALFAATIALAQYDLKRILAYSTISQLGYMFLGLGVGAMTSAIFHLFTHAFFKALLFLAAGSVMHALLGCVDIRHFSGLRRALPVTYASFLIGGLALAGFPLLAGFWSKDEIVHAAFSRSAVLGAVALATAALTAFYTFRMIFWAFHGETRLPEGVHDAHESGRWMTTPLVLLSVGAIFAGYVPVGEYLGGVMPAVHHAEGAGVMMLISGLVAIGGIAAAGYVYPARRALAVAAAEALRPVYLTLRDKYYWDEAYDLGIVRPLRRFGRVCFGTDNWVINGLLWMIALVPQAIGFVLKGFQRGAMQGYAVGMSIGLLLLVAWVLFGGVGT